jgi:Ca2+-binding EF-hand superfamily protein
MVSRHRSLSEIRAIEQIFDYCDSNKSGFIGKHDLRKFCSSMSLDEDDFDEIYHDLDRDQDGLISKDDFVSGFEDVCKQASAKSTLSRREREVLHESQMRAFDMFTKTLGTEYFLISGKR